MKNMGCDQKLQNKSAQASWIENLLPIRAVLLEAEFQVHVTLFSGADSQTQLNTIQGPLTEENHDIPSKATEVWYWGK